MEGLGTFMQRVAFFVFGVLVCWGVVCAGAGGEAQRGVGLERPVYLDAGAPIPSRVSDLLSRMTVEEKIATLVHADHSYAASMALYGKTSFGLQGMVNNATPAATLSARNALQAYVLNTSRLGIPVSISAETLHSGCAGGTVFPELVTTGATWNVTLASLVGRVIAREARACGVDVSFAPVVNLWEDARFGRLQEGFSENPTITAHLAVAYTLGLQGDGGAGPETYLGENSTASLAKHFAAYGAALGGLNAAPADVTDLTLLNVYLKPWRALARRAGLRAAMPAHNTVRHVPAHANEWLFGLLRQRFGFRGWATSDCNDIGVLQSFRFAHNASQRAALALNANGTDADLMCGTDPTKWSYNALNASLQQKLTTEHAIDTAARRILAQKFAAGLFERPFTSPASLTVLNAPHHRQLALEAAQQGIVLLQNDGLLPLASSVRRIAVIGPNGGCSNDTVRGSDDDGPSGGGGVDCEARQAMVGSYTESDKDSTIPTVFEALSTPPFAATYSYGAPIDKQGSKEIPAAVEAAKQADVAVVVVGDSLASCGEWADRDSLDLPGSQLELLQALTSQTSTPIVLVLVHGRPATFGPGNALLQKFGAVLSAFRPGEMGAEAIRNILTGATNPSGKLVQSWPRNVGQIRSGAVPFLQDVRGKWISNVRSAPDPDGRVYDPYVDSPADPIFALGDGLSYTSFALSSLSLSLDASVAAQATVDADGDLGAKTLLNATLTVSNTGGREGQTVVQLYGQDPVALGIVRPWKRIFGFQRTPTLQPGQHTALTIPVIVDDVAFHHGDQQFSFKVAPGTYTIRAGLTSRTDTLTKTIDIPTNNA